MEIVFYSYKYINIYIKPIHILKCICLCVIHELDKPIQRIALLFFKNNFIFLF
eukprot:UN02876